MIVVRAGVVLRMLDIEARQVVLFWEAVLVAWREDVAM